MSKNSVNCWELSLRQSAAKPEREGSTTIRKRSRAKRLEAQSTLNGDDIVWPHWRQWAVRKRTGIGIANRCRTWVKKSNVFVTDFGQILKLWPNRLMQNEGANDSNLYFIDPSKIRQSFLTGYRTEPLAKTGLSEKRMISVDYTLLVTNEKAHGGIYAVDETTAMVAGP